MARKYLVTEDEFLSATVTPDGDLTFTRDNGEVVSAGPVTGDAFPDLLAARDETVTARDAATAARDQAEVFSGTVVGFQDEAVASLIDTDSATKTALSATIGERLPMVNAVDHGVVGDSVGDDTDAFEAAVAEARATGRGLWLPSDLPGWVRLYRTVDARGIDVQLDGKIVISHDLGPGIILGDSTDGEDNRILSWSKIRNTAARGALPWATGKTPTVRIMGLLRGDIRMGETDYLQLFADGATPADRAVGYSTFRSTGAFIESLEFLSQNGVGWINDNKFFGGRLRDIRMAGSYGHNGNKFYGPTIERSNIFMLDGAHSNQFLQVRAEYTCTAYFGAATRNNIIESDYTTSAVSTGPNITVTDLGTMNTVVSSVRSRMSSVELLRVDRHSRIFDTAMDWSGPFPPTPGLRLLKTKGAPVFDSGVLPIEQGVLAASDPGRTSYSRLTELRLGSSDALWRIRLYCYDAGRQLLDPASAWRINSVGGWATHADGYYQIPSPTRYIYIQVTDPTVKHLRIEVFASTAGGTFEWLTLSALVSQAHSNTIVNLWRKAIERPLFQASAPTVGAAHLGERVGAHTCVARAETALSSAASSSAGSITVASASGIAVGDVLGILLADGTTHWTAVGGVAGSTITLGAPLPGAAPLAAMVVTNRWA